LPASRFWTRARANLDKLGLSAEEYGEVEAKLAALAR
jgi:hypothetical protein